jgi:hypothetical protein
MGFQPVRLKFKLPDGLEARPTNVALSPLRTSVIIGFIAATSSSNSVSFAPSRQPVVEVVDNLLVPILRSKTEPERLEMAAAMWRYARDIHLDLARQEHPDWTARELQREAARRLLAD